MPLSFCNENSRKSLPLPLLLAGGWYHDKPNMGSGCLTGSLILLSCPDLCTFHDPWGWAWLRCSLCVHSFFLWCLLSCLVWSFRWPVIPWESDCRWLLENCFVVWSGCVNFVDLLEKSWKDQKSHRWRNLWQAPVPRNLQCDGLSYIREQHTLRAESLSIFLDKSGRGK